MIYCFKGVDNKNELSTITFSKSAIDKKEQEIINSKEHTEEIDKDGDGFSEDNEEDVKKEGNSTFI